MTDEQGQQWKNALAIIWQAIPDTPEHEIQRFGDMWRFFFWCELPNNIGVSLQFQDIGFKRAEFDFQRSRMTFDTEQQQIVCRVAHARHLTPGERQLELNEFRSQFELVFRRSCYLSTLPIECTQHEQLEWRLWLKEQAKP